MDQDLLIFYSKLLIMGIFILTFPKMDLSRSIRWLITAARWLAELWCRNAKFEKLCIDDCLLVFDGRVRLEPRIDDDLRVRYDLWWLSFSWISNILKKISKPESDTKTVFIAVSKWAFFSLFPNSCGQKMTTLGAEC